ncbi:heat shock protein beta-11-like [Odontesthes bonariensis]|uniref:heat shock protein beta-11-like n=1 Tax=Odontesthes bonariensis TaxID=219752 RepID=UPI003F589E13
MLCPSAFQPAHLPLRPFLDLHWPVRSLWPEARPLFYRMEQEMLQHMQEMRQNMEYMERLHHQIFQEIDPTSLSAGGFRPIAFQELGQDGGGFALSLDTQEFSPEELSVKQVGRKLRVSGRTERKQEDGAGCCSYSSQEFRQEFQLPEGVSADTVTCSLLGGRLQIQAPRERALPDGKERIVPISVASAPALTSTSTSSSSTSGASEQSTTTESLPAEKN